jgi:hypothetical protein
MLRSKIKPSEFPMRPGSPKIPALPAGGVSRPLITLDIYHVRSPELNHLGGHQLGALTMAERACRVCTVIYCDWIKLEQTANVIQLTEC